MTQSLSLGALLIAGFIGATATSTALSLAGVAWWGVVLGYSLGGTLTLLSTALIFSRPEADGCTLPVALKSA